MLEKGVSIPLLLVFVICLGSYGLGLVYDAVTLYGNKYLNVKEWVPPQEPRARTLLVIIHCSVRFVIVVGFIRTLCRARIGGYRV